MLVFIYSIDVFHLCYWG